MFELWDKALFYAVNHGCRNSFFDAIMPYVTLFGVWELLVVAAVIMLFFRGRLRICGLMLLAGLCVLELILPLVKAWVARPRPFLTFSDVHLLAKAYGGSFPSGHAASIFLGVTIFRGFYKWGGWLWLVAAGVAFSRPYLGVHYPMDVMAGALIGAFIGIQILKVYHRCIREGS